MILSIFALLAACGPATGPGTTTRLVSSQGGLGFLPARPEKGKLFQYYQPKAASKWRGNWTRAFDLTGVAWNDPRTATLISPSHVVMAAHFIRPSDVAVMFHDKQGNPHERYIKAVRKLDGVGDIAVARLNRPLPAEVKHYRLVRPGRATVGKHVIITDQTSTLSVHRIGAISGGVISFEFAPDLDPVYRRNLVVGDSGNPSFLLENGELFLLETHTTGGPGAGPYYGDPAVQAVVRAAMAELGN